MTPKSTVFSHASPTLNFFSLMNYSSLFLLAIIILSAEPVRSSEWFVSPTGSASGTGTISNAWDLKTAILDNSDPSNKNSVVKPGDTIWLRGGTYKGAFHSKLRGSAGSWVTLRQYAGERATIDGNGFDDTTFGITGQWAKYWGFEVMNSDLNRTGDLWARVGGVDVNAPNIHLINLVIHDAGQGIGAQHPDAGSDFEVHGCVIYFNGADGNRGGHGVYAQNQTGTKRFVGNVVYANISHNFHLFGSSGYLDNMIFDGNTAYDHSVIASVSGRNFLIGGGNVAASPVIINNNFYHSLDWANTDLGYQYGGSGTLNAKMDRNYIVGHSSLTSARFHSYRPGLQMMNNVFWTSLDGMSQSSFPNNTYLSSRPTQNRIFIQPNKYETGRAVITINNWSMQNQVSVDLSNVDKNGDGVGDGPLLNPNQSYQLRNVQDYFGDITQGTYTGSPIIVPMTGRTIGQPIGLPKPPSTFPEYGVFVLIPLTSAASGNTAPTMSTIPDTSILANSSTLSLPLTIGDAETSASSLTASGTSSNPTLVPNGNIVLGGSGANRTVTVTPAANQSGSATITLTVSDGSLTANTSFVLTVNPINTAPTISSIPNTTINANSSTPALAFTVGDAQTVAGSLTVSRTSSNTTLVPTSNIVLGGSGANRTVQVTPAANQSGSATITLTVTDGSLTASTSFVLTVNPLNSAPTISIIPNTTINANSSTPTLAFTVGDAQTSASSLTVSRISSNTTLVPTVNIVLGGSGANRTVTVTSAANQSGSATITLTVSDGSLTASTSFVLTVNPINTAPTISILPNTTINENSSTPALAFTVGDAQTAAGSLTVSRTSSNTTLLPTANIVLGGSGANRTVTVAPAANQSGSATVTLTVSDGSLAASASFLLTVNPLNSAPSISGIPNTTINANSPTQPLPFTITDAQTAAANLLVSASSANTLLVPTANFILGGSGTTRTIQVTPAANQTGSTTITVSVSDGSLSASTSFALTVNPASPVPYQYLVFEAESATLTAPLQTITVGGAAGYRYVVSTIGDSGAATFSISVPDADEYAIWCRVKSSDSDSDSFYVSADGGIEDVYDTAENTWNTAWQWTVVNGRAGGDALSLNPRNFALTAGTHQIVFRVREPNTALDKILLTNDPNYVPLAPPTNLRIIH
ncbi:MAG: tandem-95 repeat protein [Acidobacteria bacterium]|nr:tandem-95 repeat protein [Acidobacteriota bacterium]